MADVTPATVTIKCDREGCAWSLTAASTTYQFAERRARAYLGQHQATDGACPAAVSPSDDVREHDPLPTDLADAEARPEIALPSSEPIARERSAKTHIVVTDERIIVSGHSWNRASCVAISAVIQTTAYIAGMFDLLAGPVELTDDPTQPVYDVKLLPCLMGRKVIAGFLNATFGLARQAPDTLLLSDNRKIDDVDAPIDPSSMHPKDGLPRDGSGLTGGYAEATAAPALFVPGGEHGRLFR